MWTLVLNGPGFKSKLLRFVSLTPWPRTFIKLSLNVSSVDMASNKEMSHKVVSRIKKKYVCKEPTSDLASLQWRMNGQNNLDQKTEHSSHT